MVDWENDKEGHTFCASTLCSIACLLWQSLTREQIARAESRVESLLQLARQVKAKEAHPLVIRRAFLDAVASLHVFALRQLPTINVSSIIFFCLVPLSLFTKVVTNSWLARACVWPPLQQWPLMSLQDPAHEPLDEEAAFQNEVSAWSQPRCLHNALSHHLVDQGFHRLLR